MTGFTFFSYGKDIFVETTRKRKTDRMLSEIIYQLNSALNSPNETNRGLPDNPEIRGMLSYYLKPATLEYTRTSTGMEYYKLNGKSSGATLFPEDVMIIKID